MPQLFALVSSCPRVLVPSWVLFACPPVLVSQVFVGVPSHRNKMTVHNLARSLLQEVALSGDPLSAVQRRTAVWHAQLGGSSAPTSRWLSVEELLQGPPSTCQRLSAAARRVLAQVRASARATSRFVAQRRSPLYWHELFEMLKLRLKALAARPARLLARVLLGQC